MMVFTPRPVRFFACALAAAFAACLAAAPAWAQAIDNKGREFLMAFQPNYSGTSTVQLHLTGDVATNVLVECPAAIPPFSQTFAVTPGSVTIVTLPATVASSWTSDAVSGNTVRASASEEFVVYMMNVQPATSDAALALPIDALDSEYFAMDWTTSDGQLTVVAPYDSTSVTITPKNAFANHPAGTPFTIQLNRGQAYFAANAMFAGTLITASNPIGVVNGNRCTNIVRGACDHIFEVAQPVQTWGTSIPVANLPTRPLGSVYRIIASEDGTTVSQDGTALAPVLNRGQLLQTGELPGSHVFSANHPIFVAQFMTGSSTGSATDGDPAMGNMIPSAQYLNRYTFATLSQTQFPLQFLTVIASSSDKATITLDGVAIGEEAFSDIGTSGLSSALLAIAAGTHNTVSNQPHGITVEGFGSYDSFLYPGGARFGGINSRDIFPPVCPPLQQTEGNVFEGSATDNQLGEDLDNDDVLDPGEDANENGELETDLGIRDVVLVDGAQNLELVKDPFTPHAPRVTFRLRPAEPGGEFSGTVRVTDFGDHVCERSVGIDFPGVAFGDWGEDVEVDVQFIPQEEREVRTAYLAAQNLGVKIYDVSHPDEIAALGSYPTELPATCPNGRGTAAFFADDVSFLEERNALFVAAGRCGIIVLDVSNPAAPVQIGSFDTAVWAEAVEIVVSGDSVIGYIADHNGGLLIVDFTPVFASTPGAPVLLGWIDSSTPGWGTGAAIDVAFRDNGEDRLVYVANSQGLRVVNVNNPASPELIGGYDTNPSGDPPEVPQDITLNDSGTIALVAAWQAGLLAIDVSDPTHPVLLNRISTTPGLAYYESEIDDGIVFATEGKGGLHTFGLGEGGLFSIEGADPVPIAGGNGWAWDVETADGVAYVTYGILEDGPNGLAGTGGFAVIELEPSNIVIDFSSDPPPDGDGDGVPDSEDNCLEVANPGQADVNREGFGDACDADYDDDGAVTAADFSALRAAYGSQAGGSRWNAEVDHDGDGAITAADFSVFRSHYGTAAGPSGLACAGVAPCPSP